MDGVQLSEAVSQRCSVKKVFLEISQNSQENTCARVSFLINFIIKEILTQVFSCEFCEISKNTFSYRAPPVTASELYCLKATEPLRGDNFLFTTKSLEGPCIHLIDLGRMKG